LIQFIELDNSERYAHPAITQSVPANRVALVAFIDVCVLGNISTVLQRFRGLWKHINWL